MVMKEIHEAVTALGPSIATFVFSLRPQEKDLFSMGQNLEGRSRSNNLASIRPAVAATLVPFSDDEESYSMDHHNAEVGVSTSSYTEERAVNTLIVPFKIKEEAATSLIGYSDSQTVNINGHTEHEDLAQIYSFVIKEDELPNTIDHQDSDARENSTTIAGAQYIPTEKSIPAASVECIQLRHPSSMFHGPVKDSVLARLVVMQHGDKCGDTQINAVCCGESADTTTECREIHGKAMNKVLKNTEKGASYKRQLTPKSYQEPGGGTMSQCGTFSMQQECSRVFSMQSSAKIKLWNKHGTCPPNAYISCKPYACPECVKCFKTKTQLTRHQRTHSGERPYHCALCGNSFSLSHHLLRHQRTHTGERPYQCNQCKKRFAFKEALKRHQRTHLVMCKNTKFKKVFSLSNPL